ncbi:SEP-domain-containing protein [Lepidopterella palustris CBS 459.81]|uniref:SEP-domain-containing protein n=1 Tax=Lepidopterella palustris CBS 459.81 TaxID=1314670 RepID=A0A8E2JHH8_9PEZI|nr:SEP-domain-containing protein [Lepidopterella palustris CBS 459.81]
MGACLLRAWLAFEPPTAAKASTLKLSNPTIEAPQLLRVFIPLRLSTKLKGMDTPSDSERDAMISEFCNFAGTSASEAETYLTASNWDLGAAGTQFWADVDGAALDDDPMDASKSTPEPPTAAPTHPGGGRTLGGGPVPAESSPSSAPAASSSRQPARRSGLRTLKDLQNQPAGHSHGPDSDHDDDDEEDGEQQDFFAGGEKSGLAVQNPNAGNPRDQINNILKRARGNVPRPGGDDERPSTFFRGTGMTLGGDDAPSRAIPDPEAEVAPPAPRAHRELHLWRDGFSVDDGPLFRYDDPANARTLDMINSGHAPLAILNVDPGQEVDVAVHPHKEEDYKKPKKKYVPFSGSGQRLGSPTPGVTTMPPPPPAAASSATPATSSTAPAAPSVEVDNSVPTITLQIRLGDGTRLQSRFNITHTIGDVYGFVNAASPTSVQRPYALMTTFPSKELTDQAAVLGNMAEFKRGGVVVQKWK